MPIIALLLRIQNKALQKHYFNEGNQSDINVSSVSYLANHQHIDYVNSGRHFPGKIIEREIWKQVVPPSTQIPVIVFMAICTMLANVLSFCLQTCNLVTHQVLSMCKKGASQLTQIKHSLYTCYMEWAMCLNQISG